MSVTPLFSKRHYEWLAAFCRAELRNGGITPSAIESLTNRLMDTNPDFKREKFLDACLSPTVKRKIVA